MEPEAVRANYCVFAVPILPSVIALRKTNGQEGDVLVNYRADFPRRAQEVDNA